MNHYTERIHREPGWKLVGIYADKGITGTSMKKRDEFNKLIRQCKRGRVDMIIVKSISRFARNTLDCIRITRMLRELSLIHICGSDAPPRTVGAALPPETGRI